MLVATQRIVGKLGRVSAAVGVAVVIAACGSSSTPKQGGDLASDLAAAADTSSLTLAPVAGRTDVISSVEQTPEARRAPRAASRAPIIVRRAQQRTAAPVPTPVRATPAPIVAPTPAPVAEAPRTQPAPTATAPAMPRPQPVQQQPPPGGWRTEAQVIRDAPFPITP